MTLSDHLPVRFVPQQLADELQLRMPQFGFGVHQIARLVAGKMSVEKMDETCSSSSENKKQRTELSSAVTENEQVSLFFFLFGVFS